MTGAFGTLATSQPKLAVLSLSGLCESRYWSQGLESRLVHDHGSRWDQVGLCCPCHKTEDVRRISASSTAGETLSPSFDGLMYCACAVDAMQSSQSPLRARLWRISVSILL